MLSGVCANVDSIYAVLQADEVLAPERFRGEGQGGWRLVGSRAMCSRCAGERS